MNRKELVLALLAAASGGHYSPVQLQKAAFLITKQIPWLISGPGFTFTPYDYGPFDSAVYDEAKSLGTAGLAIVMASPTGRWNNYAATPTGVDQGNQLLALLAPDVRKYIEEISKWVRSQSFSGLVKSIYEAYPDMRANSIFRG